MDDKELYEDLIASIEHHCPATRSLNSSVKDKCDKSNPIRAKAEAIVSAMQNATDMIGHRSKDTQTLQAVSSQLRHIASTLAPSSERERADGLSHKSLTDLNSAIRQQVSADQAKEEQPTDLKTRLGEHGDVAKLGDGRLRLSIPAFRSAPPLEYTSSEAKRLISLAEQIEELLKTKPYTGKKIDRRLNYAAIAVAKTCKMIWRDELRISDPESDPPLYLHGERDHPLTYFIEEIFSTLGINAKATSALQALEKLGGEEALITTRTN